MQERTGDLRFYDLFNCILYIRTKAVCNGASFTVRKIPAFSGSRSGTARLTGQRFVLSYQSFNEIRKVLYEFH